VDELLGHAGPEEPPLAQQVELPVHAASDERALPLACKVGHEARRLDGPVVGVHGALIAVDGGHADGPILRGGGNVFAELQGEQTTRRSRTSWRNTSERGAHGGTRGTHHIGTDVVDAAAVAVDAPPLRAAAADLEDVDAAGSRPDGLHAQSKGQDTS